MTLISISVRFDCDLPSKQDIFQRLKEHSGLVDVKIDEHGIITHPLFRRDFWLKVTGQKAEVETYFSDSWYLLEATIAVLVSMGGDAKGYKLPERASKKWDASEEFEDTIRYENTWRTVSFLGPPPIMDVILKKYRDNTGLYDISFQPHAQHPHLTDVVHALIPPDSMPIHSYELPVPEKSDVLIGIGPNNMIRSWYFVEAMIATLISLGGETIEQIPKKAWLTWERAERFYLNDPRFLKM